jgi:hypothetical protein
MVNTNLLVRKVLCKLKKGISWVKPDINSEINEIKRTSKHFKITLNFLKEKIEKGSLVPLEKSIENKLKNSDVNDIQDLEDATELANHYGRDIKSLINAFDNWKDIQAPIVLNTGKEYYLVSGNTRLMVSKAKKIKPKIWLVDL